MRRGAPRRQYNRRRSRLAAVVAALAVVPVAGLGAGVALGAIQELEIATSDESRPLIAVSQLAARAEPPPKPKPRATEPSDRLSWPLRGAVTGQFGEGRGGHTHAGIDIPKPGGTPIEAASAGRVIHAGLEDGYGNYVCIAHVKLSTCYAHLETIRAKQGAKVRRGQVIGYVGNTGNSGALHLHFEVRRGKQMYGEPLDPAKYLPDS